MLAPTGCVSWRALLRDGGCRQENRFALAPMGALLPRCRRHACLMIAYKWLLVLLGADGQWRGVPSDRPAGAQHAAGAGAHQHCVRQIELQATAQASLLPGWLPAPGLLRMGASACWALTVFRRASPSAPRETSGSCTRSPRTSASSCYGTARSRSIPCLWCSSLAAMWLLCSARPGGADNG